jgi:hypothetical protein
MRVLILTLAIVCGLIAVPANVGNSVPSSSAVAVLDAQTSAPAAPADAAQAAQPQQPQTPQINVDIDRGGRAWYASPVWIAIGGVALVLVILVIVVAARGGGGTTVVRG